MQGEGNLERLLAEMRPELQPGLYVFVSTDLDPAAAVAYHPLGFFQESEGLTLIVASPPPPDLAAGASNPMAMITLTVHSSLEAVGFLATVASQLAAAGISVNAVAGFFHDHLFIPADRALEAMNLLASFSAAADRD